MDFSFKWHITCSIAYRHCKPNTHRHTCNILVWKRNFEMLHRTFIALLASHRLWYSFFFFFLFFFLQTYLMNFFASIWFASSLTLLFTYRYIYHISLWLLSLLTLSVGSLLKEDGRGCLTVLAKARNRDCEKTKETEREREREEERER